MKQGKVIEDNFRSTIERSLENTLNFENHTIFEKYDYDETDRKVGSILNICLHHNYIYDTIIPYLRGHSVLEAVSESDRESFKKNPLKLSYYRYGVTDYWWIILAVNGYSNPYEFQDFQYLRMPTKTEIATIIDREMYNNHNYGTVPE
jgi:hypothetical protein